VTANEEQHGGRHYIIKAIQPWDYIIANQLGYLEGNIIKYISRYKDKGGLDDLIKASHYLEKLIEVTLNERVQEVANSKTVVAGEKTSQVWKE
jgi:hypothetical protein